MWLCVRLLWWSLREQDWREVKKVWRIGSLFGVIECERDARAQPHALLAHQLQQVYNHHNQEDVRSQIS